MEIITSTKVVRYFTMLAFCLLFLTGVKAQPSFRGDYTPVAETGTTSKALTLASKVNDVTVKVHGAAGVLPEGTQLKVRLLSDSEEQVYIRSLKRNSGITLKQASFYDITLYNLAGEEIQPSGEVTVTFSGIESPVEGSLVVMHAEKANPAMDDFSFSKKYPAVKVDNNAATLQHAHVNSNEIRFNTAHFSVYVVGVTPTATYNFMVDGTLQETQIVLNGESLLEPEMPVASAGKRFTGWYIQGFTTPLTFHQAISVSTTQTYTVNAVFETVWHVFFNYNGELVATKDVVAPATTTSAAGIPLVVNVPGKVFSHWSLNVDGTAFNFSTPITSNTTLYAVLTDRWVVTFNTQGGSALMPEYVVNGQNASQPGNPTKVGFSFSHWSETIGGSAFNFSTPITAAKTLYAVWNPVAVNYTVVYWQQNAEDDDYTYVESVTRTALTGSAATYNATSYTGFTLNSTKTNAPINNVIVKGDGSTLKNVYYDRNVWTFKMEYKPNNQWLVISTSSVKYGQSTRPWYDAAVNANPGYRWLISRNSTTSYSEAPDMPNSNLTVSGLYSGNVAWTIHYKEYQTNIPIHEDYIFYASGSGFNFSIEDGIAIPGFTVTPLSYWEPLNQGTPLRDGTIYYTRNNYNISFNTMDGGSPVISTSIPFEASIANQALPGYIEGTTTRVADGITYSFGGWYTSPVMTDETKFNFAGQIMPAHNMALYAKWNTPVFAIINHQILQNPGSTSDTLQIHVPYGSTVDINDLTHEIPVGLDATDFVGWYWYVGDLFVAYDFDMPVYFQFELFPVWREYTYSVTYSLNGATGTTPVDNNIYHLGAGVGVAHLPADVVPPAGKVFIGWIDQNGVKAYPNRNHTITGNMFFTAQWNDVIQKTQLTYSANGGNGDDIVLELDNNITHSTLPSNTYTRSGYTFVGWNTVADGSGVTFAAGENIIVNNSPALPNVLYAQWANLSLSKVASSQFFCYQGDVVNYTITLTNGGEVNLYSPQVTDPTATTGPDYTTGDTNSNGILDAGESWTYTATYSITNGNILAGAYTNVASATAYADTDNDGIGDLAVIAPDASATILLAGNCCTLESVSVTYTPIACYGGYSTVTLTPVGGHAPLTYTFNGVSQIENGVFTNITAGTYTWTVSESSIGCAPLSGSLQITEPAALLVESVVTHITCPDANDGVIQLTISGGTTPYVVAWSGPNGYTSSNVNVTGLMTGTYSVTVLDDAGCSFSDTFQVNTTPDVTAPVAPALADVTTECSITLTAPTAEDNCVGTVTGTTTDPLTYNEQGTYLVTWTFNDGNGNSSTATQNVIVNDETAPTIICPANITVPTDQGSIYATNVDLGVPSAMDNCSVAAVTNNAPTSYPIGQTSVVWT
ncbi:MAG: InlB B-repeat-containing protein, partial [Lentimicrobiaceae bacterium]|nr:InlB B-repeat-containing protein [Lentimicrobiaceae bacterium]